MKDKEDASEIFDEKEHHIKNKTFERISRKIKQEIISDEKSPDITVLKEVKIKNIKEDLRKNTEKSDKSFKNKKQTTEFVENKDYKSRNRKTFKHPKVYIENKKQKKKIFEIQKDKRTN